MYVGNQAVEVLEKNQLGGGFVKIVEGPYLGKRIGFSKFDGFVDVPVGQVAMAFIEIGHFAKATYRKGSL